MYKYSTTIRMRDTDATGSIYFTEVFRIAGEAFEAYLVSQKWQPTDYLLPIVNANADFSARLKWGDVVTVHLSVERFGTTSFTLLALLEGVGKVSITHVTVSGSNPIPIPERFLDCLRGL